LVWGQAVEVRGVVAGRCGGVGGVHSGSDAGELDVHEAYGGRWGSVPYAWFASVRHLNQKCLKLAAWRPPPWRYDRMARRTDPAVCTKKFDRAYVVYGSPLHGPLMNPAL
jgi:hypothetical protein